MWFGLEKNRPELVWFNSGLIYLIKKTLEALETQLSLGAEPVNYLIKKLWNPYIYWIISMPVLINFIEY